MGYTTTFDGAFTITPALTEPHRTYLTKFSETRRMKRDAIKAELRSDIIRAAAGLPIGPEGAYFVGAGEFRGQEYRAPDVVNGSEPPQGQPGLWCQWIPNEEGTALQ